MYAMEYIASVSIKAGQLYTTAEVISTHPEANMMKMKSHDVKVGINGTDQFPVSYDEETYITAGKSYIFSKDCVVVVGRYVIVT